LNADVVGPSLQIVLEILDGLARAFPLLMDRLGLQGKNATGLARTDDAVFHLAAAKGHDALEKDQTRQPFDETIRMPLGDGPGFLKDRGGLDEIALISIETSLCNEVIEQIGLDGS